MTLNTQDAPLPEKSVKQFCEELEACGVDFEYRYVRKDGRVFQSEGWKDAWDSK